MCGYLNVWSFKLWTLKRVFIQMYGHLSERTIKCEDIQMYGHSKVWASQVSLHRLSLSKANFVSHVSLLSLALYRI